MPCFRAVVPTATASRLHRESGLYALIFPAAKYSSGYRFIGHQYFLSSVPVSKQAKINVWNYDIGKIILNEETHSANTDSIFLLSIVLIVYYCRIYTFSTEKTRMQYTFSTE